MISCEREKPFVQWEWIELHVGWGKHAVSLLLTTLSCSKIYFPHFIFLGLISFLCTSSGYFVVWSLHLANAIQTIALAFTDVYICVAQSQPKLCDFVFLDLCYFVKTSSVRSFDESTKPYCKHMMLASYQRFTFILPWDCTLFWVKEKLSYWFFC